MQRVAYEVGRAATLAAAALGGNDPAMGVDYLVDAYELLRAAVGALRRVPPTAT